MNNARYIWLLALVLFWKTGWAAHPGSDKKDKDRDRLVVAIRAPKVVTPGKFETFILELSNEYPHPLDYQISVDKPAGWKFLSSLRSVSLAPGERRSITFLMEIDRTCEVGEKTILFQFYDEVRDIRVEEAVVTEVANVHLLKTELLRKPEHVVGGQQCAVDFLVRNLGNCPEMIYLSSRRGIVSIAQLELAPDSAVRVTVKRPVPENIERPTYIASELIVECENLETLHERVSVKAFPSKMTKSDPYLRFPLTLQTSYIGVNTKEGYVQNLQFAVEGKGHISHDKQHYLHVKARGPNRASLARARNFDEYYAAYRYRQNKDENRETLIRAGDFSYNLSPVLETARWGRGLEVSKTMGQAHFGGYYNRPRFRNDIQSVGAGFFGYTFSDKWKTRANVLHKTYHEGGPAILGSAENSFVLGDHLLSAELGVGTRNGLSGLGGGLQSSGRLGNFQYSSNVIYASRHFPGFFSNSLFANSTLRYLMERFTFSLGHSFNESNPAQDTIYTVAPYSEDITAGVSFRASQKIRTQLRLVRRSREDRFDPKKFSFREYLLRYRYTFTEKTWRYQLGADAGQTRNLLVMSDDNTATTVGLRGQAAKTFWNKLRASAFFQYLYTNRYDTEARRYFYHGGQLDFRLDDHWNFRGSYRNDYLIEDYNRDRALLDLELNVNYAPHRFAFLFSKALARNTVGKTNFFVRASYTYQLNTPISKKKNLYSLIGNLAGEPDDVDGIIVSVAGKSMVVNGQGRFEFHDLEAGEHYLHIDGASLPLGVITRPVAPMAVTVAPKVRNYVKIKVIHSGEIAGKVNFNFSEQAVTTAKLPVLILKVQNNEGEEYLTYSQADGSFSFRELAPGKWTVRIVPSSLPKGWVLKQNNLQVSILPDRARQVEMEMEQQKRRINFSKKTFDVKVK